MSLYGPVKARAVQVGHAQVAENQIILLCLQHAQGLTPVVGRIHRMTVTTQQARQPSRNTNFVIDNRIVLAGARGGTTDSGCSGTTVFSAGSSTRNIAPYPG